MLWLLLSNQISKQRFVSNSQSLLHKFPHLQCTTHYQFDQKRVSRQYQPVFALPDGRLLSWHNCHLCLQILPLLLEGTLCCLEVDHLLQ